MAAREVNPFSITKITGVQPIVDFRGRRIPEYDPKETGASKEPVREPHQTSAEIQEQLIPSSKTEDKAESKESSSASSVPSSDSAGNGAKPLESPTESGEEKTKTIARPEMPLSPALPTSPTSPTKKTVSNR